MKDSRVTAAAVKLISEYGLDADKLSVKMPKAFLIHIASCIKNWSDIAPYLGFEIGDFEEVFQSSGSEKSKKLFVLEKWSTKLGEEATFCQLIEIFLVAEREDLAERVCEYYAIWNKEKTTISPDHKPCNRNHKHYLNHTHHTNGTNHRLSLQKCVPYQIAYSAHQKVHHPLMYTRRGRPTKRFDIQAANANRISKPHPLVNGDHASMFDEVQRSGSHDTAPIRVIQIEDDTNGRGKGNKRQCAQRCALCIYIIVLLIFGLTSVAAFTLSYTIVTPLPHTPHGVTLLTRDDPVLIRRLKPFYTHSAGIHIMNMNSTTSMEELDLNSKANNFNSTEETRNNVHWTVIEYYQMRCSDLRTLNNTVDMKGAVSISEGHTHIIYEEYLVAGSTINFHFQFDWWNTTTTTKQENTTVNQPAPLLSEEMTTSKEATTTDEAMPVPKRTISELEHTAPSTHSECITQLHIFNEHSYTANMLSDQEMLLSTEQPQTVVCIQNTPHKQQQKQTYNFTLSTLNSSHQRIQVSFKSHTLGTTKSLNYEITGTRMTFDLDQHRPTCVATPTNQSSCMLRFSNHRIYRFSEEDCVLGLLVNASHNYVEIEFWTSNNKYVMIMHYVLVGLGLAFLIVFSGLVSGCISMCNCG